MQVKNILKFNEFSTLPSRGGLTRLRSDLVITQDCSPTPYEYLLRYADLHLEYFLEN